ncbi:MAG TPA: four helix bundle protein [Bacteroidales bacterium]|jgi:four helix bundle protein|nr:four helix bundle protein [Bacteroidales bacterium]HOU99032.1 four helix bundle protein [Bacteroidales bacterium]
MFDFEKLDVYQVVKEQNNKVLTFLKGNNQIDQLLADHWKKASLNSVLNLAEGTGRKNTNEKKDFLTAARGNIFESTTILQIIKDLGHIDETTYMEYYEGYEKASKMLLGMFRSYNKREQSYQSQEFQSQEENYNI